MSRALLFIGPSASVGTARGRAPDGRGASCAPRHECTGCGASLVLYGSRPCLRGILDRSRSRGGHEGVSPIFRAGASGSSPGVGLPRRRGATQPMPVSRSPAEVSPRARERTTIVSRRGERLQRSSRLISVRCRSQIAAELFLGQVHAVRDGWRRFSANCCLTDSCGFTRCTLASGRRKVYRQALAGQNTD